MKMLQKKVLYPKRRWVAGLVMCAVLATILSIWLWRTPKALPIETSPVSVGTVEDTVLATGRIEAAKLVSVGAQVTGQVTALHVKLGDAVSKGELVAEIDALTQQNALRNATAQVRSAQARLDARKASLAQLASEARRQRALMETESTSRAELESAAASYTAAEADIKALNADLDQAKIAAETAQLNLGYTRVIAPMDGVVVAVVTEQGRTVNANQSAPTIIKLAQLDKMIVKSKISEADIDLVAVGQRVNFRLLGRSGVVRHAVINSVEPGPTTIAQPSPEEGAAAANDAAASKAVYYNAIFHVDNPDRALRIDMTATATIVLAQAEGVLTIPSASLIKRGPDGAAQVQVLGTSGEVTTRDIRVGLDNRSLVEVTQGLIEGEQVVVPVSP